MCGTRAISQQVEHFALHVVNFLWVQFFIGCFISHIVPPNMLGLTPVPPDMAQETKEKKKVCVSYIFYNVSNLEAGDLGRC